MNQEPDFGDGYEELDKEISLPPYQQYTEQNTNMLLDDMFSLKQQDQQKKELGLLDASIMQAPPINTDFIDAQDNELVNDIITSKDWLDGESGAPLGEVAIKEKL